MDTEADVVEVSWQTDRRRYSKAIRAMPAMRKNRWVIGPIFFVGFVLYGLATGPSMVRAITIGSIAGGTFVFLSYFLTRYLVLRQIPDGANRWRFDKAGIRMQGDVVTEVPWTEVHSWYVAGDHLILLPVNHVGRRPQSQMGVAAPVEAFSDAELTLTRQMLQDYVGPEFT
jgi:hypothetical protein